MPDSAGLSFQESQLESMSGRGTLAVLKREILADLTTPVAAYLKTCASQRHAFLLESVEGGENLARYSFLGGGARRVFRIQDGRLSVQEAGGERREIDGPPLQALRHERSGTVPVPLPDMPRFTGGLVGFFSYDFVRSLETIPTRGKDLLQVPDAVLGDYDTVLAFDHRRNRMLLMASVRLDGGGDERRRSYRDAEARLQDLADRLDGPLPPPVAARAQDPATQGAVPSAAEFKRQVENAKSCIRNGDIFQVVLSRRLSRPWSGPALPVYRALRTMNPSPYHFLLQCEEDALVGASPEMLARVEGRSVTAHPIAGTRPRGADADADQALQADLESDAKERAEHVMLVDLARNDIGRVSRAGSVHVDRFADVERYSHVMHLVSSVKGELAAGKDALDALASCFPAGTLTGAPKVRAMEIIEASEPSRRGPYGGAVAYLDHGGDLDSCITIRTVVLTGGQAHIQAGAGIVADSSPEKERQEIAHKAEVMLSALAQAAGEPL